jgi:uncharacterized coiled-coil protein SlyX
VNFYDNISKKEASPPKLLSYRRLPSVTSTDAYSEKDTASDTEVTKAIKKIPLATRSCRSSPTAPHRYANTYIDTITLAINPLPFSDTDTDSEMAGKKCSNKGSPMSDDRSDDDRRKGLRQGTLTKTKTSTLSLLVGAMPVPIGGTGAIKKTTLEKASNQSTGDGPLAPPLLAGIPTNEEGSFSLPEADSTPKGAGLQDDSIDLGTSPSQQPEHLLLQSQMVPHQAVGNTDPDLQATFDDPEHLSKVPGSWEELEQREAERLRKTSISSNSSSSQQMQLAGAGATAIGTPKRKNTKKHKQQTTRASKAEDNDSSSTSVEDMEEDEKTQTVVRKVVLAPTSKRFTDIEAQIQQLHSTINGLTQWLEQQLHTGQQERDSIQKAVSALAADCRNSHIRLESHEDGINNLQQHTGMMQTRIEDVEHKINYNTKRLIDVVDSVSTLQDNYTSLQQNMDSIIKEFQHVKTRAAGDTAEDTCETGVFISGIQEIMKSYNMDPRSDPVAVAGRLLKEIECFHAINRIYVADRSAVNRGKRHEARAVIVYLNSTFYKRQTTILLKKLFEKYKLKGTISDVFPAEESSRALALNRYAADKRQDKSMTRTRVINRGGTAYLQHTTSQDKFYKDANISEDSLKPYFETRQATGNRDRPSGDRTDRAAREDRSRMVARRERRYRNGESNSDKETRDQERAAARNTNSSNATSNNNIHRNRNYRGTNSPPARLSTPNTHPIGNPRQLAVPQPGPSQPQHSQQQYSNSAQTATAKNYTTQHPPSPQQQQHGAALHPQQLPLQSRGIQQGNLYNDNNQQQWTHGADGPAVNNFQVYNTQGGYVHPVPPQMMASYSSSTTANSRCNSSTTQQTVTDSRLSLNSSPPTSILGKDTEQLNIPSTLI